MSRIQLADPAMGEAERRRVVEVLDTGLLADGPPVREFEDAFSTFCGAAHGVATANGTTALHAALHALGIGEGDRVLTTPFSFVASANAVRLCGATPVFADVDPETYNLDPTAAEAAVRDLDGGVDAVLVVHLYGLPADVDGLAALAERHDAALVEDAAQAHGAEYGSARVGSLGDAACFSFYPTKNMTTGEGGMVVTDRSDVAARAARFVNHGREGTYTHRDLGHNFRMTSIAAAIGLAQLERLPADNAARREHAARLTEALDAVPDVVPPVEPAGRRHVYNQYTVRCGDRDGLRAHLDDAGVETGVYYPTPIHEQPAYGDCRHRAPEAERAASEVLSLPVHPGLADDDLARVVDAVRSAETPPRPRGRA